MHHLSLGMHAAVGATRAGDRNRRAGDLRKRGLKRILHRAAAGLRLPAKKSAAVVFDAKRDSGHEKSIAVSANEKATARGRGPGKLPWRLDEAGEHTARLFLLRVVAFLDHLVQQVTGAVLVAHLFIRLGQIEFGRNFLPTRVRLV